MAATSHGIQVVERERVAERQEVGPRKESPRAAPPARPAGAVPAPPMRLTGMAMVAVATIFLGAWAGIVPYVGPLFGYGADGTLSWYWNMEHAVLWLVPGAGAVVAGLGMLGVLPMATRGRGRLAFAASGFLAATSGAWLVIGPMAWPVLERSNDGVFAPSTPLSMLSHEVGYSLGTGVLIVSLGAWAVGRAARRRPAPRAAVSAGA